MKIAAAMLALLPLWGDTVNPDSAVIADFEKRVADYAQLRKTAEAKLPKLRPTESTEEISHRQHELRAAMVKLRPTARQGDFFTPAIDREFRRLMVFALQPGDATRIRKSFNHAEPVTLQPKINHPYPVGDVPLQSTPPSILQNLPHLPDDVEYRFVGRTLILLDTRANLILDYMTNVGPSNVGP
jgi:hypothetical protein